MRRAVEGGTSVELRVHANVGRGALSEPWAMRRAVEGGTSVELHPRLKRVPPGMAGPSWSRA